MDERAWGSPCYMEVEGGFCRGREVARRWEGHKEKQRIMTQLYENAKGKPIILNTNLKKRI